MADPFVDNLAGDLGKKLYKLGADTLRNKFTTKELVNPFDLSNDSNYEPKISSGSETEVLEPPLT